MSAQTSRPELVLKGRARCQLKIKTCMETDVSLERPGSELNESSMRASSPVFAQPALTIIHAVTRFLIST